MAPAPPLRGTDLNGIALPDACFKHAGQDFHVFVIGDWGGVLNPNATIPVPADKRSKLFPAFARDFVQGIDDCAQQRVAGQMKHRAPLSKPDYILNVGDNFYWGGVKADCGSPLFVHKETGQWSAIFEHIYIGAGLDGKQWLGVLGNHDYGGYTFTSAWDQVIAYTWGGAHSTGRWVMPAQYWSVKVRYPDFSMDYYFVDSNVHTVFPPEHDVEHNLCGLAHNPQGANCGEMGPRSLQDCPAWFDNLWKAELQWLEHALQRSTAQWQVVVTHFPPTWGRPHWSRLSQRYGIDLMLTGHKHLQDVWSPESEDNFLRPTAVIISGGGGGITSEGIPDSNGKDDQYGFMDLTLSKEAIQIEAVSHGGYVRSTTLVRPRLPDAKYGQKEQRPTHRAKPGGGGASGADFTA